VKYSQIRPEPKYGREFQHLEDLVFLEGSNGAQYAISVLEGLAEDASNAMVKWDGNPTIYWGRNKLDQFVLVNKNAWGRAEHTTPESLEEFILTTGKGEPWRKQFAENLTAIWPILERETLHGFKGYFYGDLLFSPNKPINSVNETIEFTPNNVTYRINRNTELGESIATAKVGIAVHKHYTHFGDKAGVPVKQTLANENVVYLSQTRAGSKVSVDSARIAKLHETLDAKQDLIETFLTPFYGLSDMSNIIYKYVNHMSREQQLDQLGESFFDWLLDSKVSENKQGTVARLVGRNPGALDAIFELVTEIMSIKNSIIEQLDANSTDIQAATLNEAGGEGYILLDEKVKLVPRHRWRPF
jgi:hypothetical protein